MNHVFLKCQHPCSNPGYCSLCDGGLAACGVCGGAEGSLLDECPGVRLTPEQHDWNYQGNLRRWRRGGGSAMSLDSEVIAAFCAACDAVQLMRWPRRWEPEIVALGGPEWTSECPTCGNTVDVTEVMRRNQKEGV